MRMTKDQIKQAVQTQISQAEGYEFDELGAMREEALDYYYNRSNAAPTMPGRSAVQSSDVADMVEAVTAQIMPAFITENIVEFEPISEDDIAQAESETQAVNYVVMDQNNGFHEFQCAVKDALLLRNGFTKTFIDEEVKIDTDTSENLTELEYGELVSGAVEDVSGVDNGYQVLSMEKEDGFYTCQVKYKKTKREICVRSIDPLCMSWQQGWDSIFLQDCPFVAEYSLITRSELVSMGYKRALVSQVQPGGKNQAIQNARSRDSDTKPYQGVEPSQDLLDYWECYARLDTDGDGIAELMKVCIAGDVLLDTTSVEFVPYASGTPFLQPHRFNGLGLFDKLRSIQDSKTAAKRQLLDNQNHANNSRTGLVDGMVDMDSFTNSRPGGGVIIQSPDALVPFPFTDVGPSCINTLNYLDKERSEAGGASLDLLTAEAQIAGDTAHGVERQMTSKEMLAAMMTRNLADTLVRTTFQLVHEAMRLWLPDAINFRFGGQFITTNPAEWPERERVTVKVGLSNAERTRKKSAIETVISRQDYLYTNGFQGTMVSDESIYNATIDWCRTVGVDSSERYFVDPNSEEAQQAQQQKAQQAQEQQAYQERLLSLQQQIEERKANNDDAKVIEDGRQHDDEMQLKWAELKQKDEYDEATLTVETLKMVDNESGNESKAATG